ncbi:MAG TPA: TolC family protein [Vicinamibacterales bacterium]|nr:TolC family protein [Vicinamibacterales bacterium]
MITRSSSVALAVVMCAAGAFAQTTAVRAGGLGQASLTGPAGSPRVQLNLDAKTDRSPAPIALTADTLPLTLDEAVRRAVEHNPDLLVVRLATEVEAAHVGEARTAYTPTFSTLFGRSSVDAAPTNFLLGTSSVDSRDWFSSTGVRQRVPWGNGTWSVSWDASRTTSNNFLNSFDPTVQSGFRVAFSQPLLKDRTIDSASQQLIITKRNEESSELQFRESAVQTVAAVKQTYWTLKALRANVGVQQRSLELAEELARQNEARVRFGQSPPLDLVQVQAEVADRREGLIRARAAADDAEDQLRRLIIDPSDRSFWSVRVDPIDEPPGRTAAPDVDAVVAQALDRRYDLGRARNDVKNASTDIEFYSNQKLPDIRIETSYSGTGLGGTQLLRTGGFPGVVTGRIDSGFGDVLGQVFKQNYPVWSLGVTVSYPLGRSFEQVSAVRAGVERRQADARVASLQLDVARTIRQAARQLGSTAEREDAARAGAALAEQRFESEQRRYEVGLSTSFLVTQAQRDLLQAQVALLQATLDYQSSLVSFEALQLAPAVSASEGIALRGSNVVPVPTTAPRGLFRANTGGL